MHRAASTFEMSFTVMFFYLKTYCDLLFLFYKMDYALTLQENEIGEPGASRCATSTHTGAKTSHYKVDDLSITHSKTDYPFPNSEVCSSGVITLESLHELLNCLFTFRVGANYPWLPATLYIKPSCTQKTPTTQTPGLISFTFPRMTVQLIWARICGRRWPTGLTKHTLMISPKRNTLKQLPNYTVIITIKL